MKLMKMTDFVLNVPLMFKPSEDKLLACVKYANFLNQPLTLAMFQGKNKYFEGFKVISTKPKNILFDGYTIFSEYGLEYHTIEDLLKISVRGEEVDFELTSTAIKNLGL